MPDLSALEPVVAGPLADLVEGVWDGRIDPTIVERCRRRMCALLDARPDAGRHATAPEVTGEPDDRDRACLSFTEQWVLDPHAMTDAHAAAVTAVLSPSQCASFTMALAVLEAQIRADLTLRALA